VLRLHTPEEDLEVPDVHQYTPPVYMANRSILEMDILRASDSESIPHVRNGIH
jgi:hypothetical protein